MPTGVIGPGLPVNVPRSKSDNLGLGQTGIHAINFIDPPDGKYTLGETLSLPDWRQIIPESKILSKYIKDKLFNSEFIPQIVLNFIHIFTSPLFLLSFVALLTRAIVFSTDDELSKEENDAETVRVYADAFGYFLAPFILTLSAGIIGLIITIKQRYDSHQKLKLILQDYKKIRTSYVKSHEYIAAFYIILENMTILKELESCPHLTLAGPTNENKVIIEIEKKLKSAFEKIDLKYNIYGNDVNGNEIKHLYDANISEVVLKLEKKLFSKRFKFIFDGLKVEFKTHAILLYKEKKFGDIPFRIIENFCDRINFDYATQKLILGYLGRRSSKKVEISTSILIKKIRLYEESTLFSIKEALNSYWNEPQENPIIHPYHVYFNILVAVILYEIYDNEPHWILVERQAVQDNLYKNELQPQTSLQPIVPMYMRGQQQAHFVPIISEQPFVHVSGCDLL